MSLLLHYLSDEEKKMVKKITMPDFIEPMKAVLTEECFSDSQWLFEEKLDGERCLIFKKGKNISLRSRTNKENNMSYPEIVNAVKSISSPDFIIDGEIVTFVGKITSFAQLQTRFGTEVEDIVPTDNKIYYYVFDFLYYDGYDLRSLPLLIRKKLLKTLLSLKKPLLYLQYKQKEGLSYFEQACKKGWEGIIGKKISSKYVSKRSSDWLKFKCWNEQEFVIGGYTESPALYRSFGALLIGYYEKGHFMYAGKVGTGYTENLLVTLGDTLKKIEIKKNPFFNYDMSEKNIHWVKPKLVCQIRFTEWTTGNKLRHPSFIGLRRDKLAKEVKKETPIKK